ncbi:MAG: MBL fold metallo-hydrolase [Pseudomonadota bacterium]
MGNAKQVFGRIARLGGALLLALGAPFGHAHQHEPLELDALLGAFGWDFATAEVRTEKLSDGFYVLFGIGGNVGVSVGDSGTLVVDDQFPQMMPKLKAAMAEIGSQGVDFAVNTHWHFDHAEGNLTLGPEGTWIVAQENSRAMMRDDHVINLVALKYLQKAYPEAAQPVITYTDRMRFHFNGEAIDLLHFGPAHTTGDTAVFFRGNNAVHMGDVFNRGYPFIDADNGGGIDGMIAFCEAVLGEIERDTIVIPGHGEVSDWSGFASYISMLKTVRLRVSGMISDGKRLSEIQAARPTAEYDATYGDPSGFVDRVYVSLKR